MTANSAQRVRLEVVGGIAFLTFVRPNEANTIDLPFAEELLAAAAAIKASTAVRAILMTGEGKNFCFGGDLKRMTAAASGVEKYLLALTGSLHRGMALLAESEAPLIAAVNGTAAGAGLGLALLADIAIAGRSAKFAPAYSGVALTPDGGSTFTLPRVIGYRRAMEIFLTNRVLNSEEALAWGLVNDVVEDASLIESATKWAERLAKGPLGAFGGLKRLMAHSLPGFEAQLERESESIAARAASAEGREGIAAFLEKRAPQYASRLNPDEA